MTRRGPTGLDALKEIGKRMNDLTDLAKQAMDTAEKAAETSQSFTVDGKDGPITGVMGMTTRTVVGGAHSVAGMGTSFGGAGAAQNAEFKPADKTEIDDAREPLIDLFDEGTELVLTAELPGVTISDVSVELDGRDLLLTTTGEHKFRKQLTLSDEVVADTLGTSLRNGILEIRLSKSETE